MFERSFLLVSCVLLASACTVGEQLPTENGLTYRVPASAGTIEATPVVTWEIESGAGVSTVRGIDTAGAAAFVQTTETDADNVTVTTTVPATEIVRMASGQLSVVVDSEDPRVDLFTARAAADLEGGLAEDPYILDGCFDCGLYSTQCFWGMYECGGKSGDAFTGCVNWLYWVCQTAQISCDKCNPR